MNFKFIYEGISKKISFSLLTILQLTVGIVCIYLSLVMMSDSSSAVRKMNNYFSDQNYYMIDRSKAKIDLANINGEVLKDIKKYLDSKENIEFLSANSTVTLMKEKDSLEDAIVSFENVQFDKSNYSRSQSYQINKKFIEKMNYKFLDGGIDKFNINTKDNDSKMPIILGYNYKDKYSVGDEIEEIHWSDEGNFKKGTMVVVGVLDNNNYICEQGVIENITSLNNSILLPFNEDNMLLKGGNKDSEMIRTVDLFNYITKGYIILGAEENVSNFKDDLQNFKYKLDIKNLNEEISKYKKDNFEDIKPILSVTIAVMVFTIISIVVVMINSILTDKKEFGINMLLGATLKDIKVRVIGQVLVLLGISIVLSTIIILAINVIPFNMYIYGFTLSIISILITIICIIIVLNLKRYSVSDLVRRNE